MLIVVRIVSRLLYGHKVKFVGDVPEDKWEDIRAIAVLNHTSLYEPLLVGFAPYSLIWDLAGHGVLPVAEKTMKRRIGLFFKFLVRHVIIVTRARDQTWTKVLRHIDDKSLTLILPEGRMKRRTGLDSNGRPLTIRGGIADILEVLDTGRLLVVYSGGLHHIQAPGETLPRVFEEIHVRMEFIDIKSYRSQLGIDDPKEFRTNVIKDLTARRDRYCPEAEQASKDAHSSS